MDSRFAARIAQATLDEWAPETRRFLSAAELRTPFADSLVWQTGSGSFRGRVHIWPDGPEQWFFPRGPRAESSTYCGCRVSAGSFREVSRGDWAYLERVERQLAEEREAGRRIYFGDYSNDKDRLCDGCRPAAASYPECSELEEYPPLPPDVQASVIARLVEAASEPAFTDASSLSGLFREALLDYSVAAISELGEAWFERLWEPRTGRRDLQSPHQTLRAELKREYKWSAGLMELLSTQVLRDVLHEDLGDNPVPPPPRQRNAYLAIGPDTWLPEQVEQRLREAARSAAPAPEPRGAVRSQARRRRPLPRAVVQMVWQRDEGCGVYCGATANLHVDHIVPVVLGGSDDPKNLQLLCAGCNLSKGGRV